VGGGIRRYMNDLAATHPDRAPCSTWSRPSTTR
jgi:hypothetical protein